MIYKPKITKWKVSEVIDSMYKDWYTLVQFIESANMAIWHKPITIKRQKKQAEVPLSQILYSPVSWTPYSPKKYCEKLRDPSFMKKYLDFRQARRDRHKDKVSALWEKKMFNVINKYPKPVISWLLDFSSAEWYMSIVEEKKMIEDLMVKHRIDTKKRESIDEDLKREDQARAALESKRKRQDAIKNSWKSESYWEDVARKKIKEQFPRIDDIRIPSLIPSKITSLLKKEWFL